MGGCNAHGNVACNMIGQNATPVQGARCENISHGLKGRPWLQKRRARRFVKTFYSAHWPLGGGLHKQTFQSGGGQTLENGFLILVLAACAVVLVILLLGINSFRRGGAFARENSNKFMRWRLIAQFVAILLIVAFVYLRRQSGG